MLKNELYYLPSIPSKYPDMALPCAIEPQGNEFFLKSGKFSSTLLV